MFVQGLLLEWWLSNREWVKSACILLQLGLTDDTEHHYALCYLCFTTTAAFYVGLRSAVADDPWTLTGRGVLSGFEDSSRLVLFRFQDKASASVREVESLLSSLQLWRNCLETMSIS